VPSKTNVTSRQPTDQRVPRGLSPGYPAVSRSAYFCVRVVERVQGEVAAPAVREAVRKKVLMRADQQAEKQRRVAARG
jgi:hypothetical protein